MTAANPEADALLAHVVSQVQQNVDFLVSQNYLAHSDASAFLSKLNNISIGAVAPVMPTPAPTPFAARRTPIVMSPQPVMAKATWGYNEDGADPADLSFSAGDMIEIIEETNPDWWTGKVNGRQALFPSSYVEKVASSASAPVPTMAAMPTPTPSTGGRTLPPAFNGSKEKPVYKPFGAAHQSANAPPPPGAGVNNVGLQEDAGQDKKKSKYGKYGNTMAHSAAGGVGFGAGAAIGGGLVRAIF
ncbi:SH3 domain-containing protein [Lentinula aciculospora]|uniref:SH3 domain-containing protein n=1 Tax=Lentinula aciculospora TaxID=153920 RepID=A0A9W9ADZ0_9AGAR|nr:SH3 domain-containing protein [Lentinula aciculospora]